MKNEFDQRSNIILIITSVIFVINLITLFFTGLDKVMIGWTIEFIITVVSIFIFLFIFGYSLYRLRYYYTDLVKVDRNATCWRIYFTLIYSFMVIFTFFALTITAN